MYTLVHPPGLEPRTTDPKSVMISISPWVQYEGVYYYSPQNSTNERLYNFFLYLLQYL